ncbi:uncharacterized protein LOC117082234 [Trachypithecus francoisi]|uniref:uncharacterized protein LOC117082234 n=1 Tax=Trachypithecus francoisi TaxID=54180 RepID=UPI00141AE069|nr:uncharacterized protein LOC117082234 [Trachypithecus francoisi]
MEKQINYGAKLEKKRQPTGGWKERMAGSPEPPGACAWARPWAGRAPKGWVAPALPAWRAVRATQSARRPTPGSPTINTGRLPAGRDSRAGSRGRRRPVCPDELATGSASAATATVARADSRGAPTSLRASLGRGRCRTTEVPRKGAPPARARQVCEPGRGSAGARGEGISRNLLPFQHEAYIFYLKNQPMRMYLVMSSQLKSLLCMCAC